MRFLWPGSVEVVCIGAQYPLELLLLENEQVIETLATHTSEKALTHGIRSRGVIRCFEHFYATRMCNPSEGRPKLAIVIPKQVFRPPSIRCGDPSLLCGPSIGGIACHADIDHPPRVQEGGEESAKRTEEEESRPGESRRPRSGMRECAERWSSSVHLVALWYGLAACTSEWLACTRECPI